MQIAQHKADGGRSIVIHSGAARSMIQTQSSAASTRRAVCSMHRKRPEPLWEHCTTMHSSRMFQQRPRRRLPLSCVFLTLLTLCCCRYRYGSKIYFSSNSGSGIFEVDYTSLTAVLDRTGADACDFISTRCALLMCSPL